MPAIAAVLFGVGATASVFALSVSVVLPRAEPRPVPVWFAVAALAFLALVAVVASRRRHSVRVVQTARRAPLLNAVDVASVAFLAPFYWHLIRELPSGMSAGVISPMSFMTSVYAQVGVTLSLITATIRTARAAA